MKVERTVPFRVSLDESTDNALRQLAITLGQSKASLVRRGVVLVLAESGLVDADAPDRVEATPLSGRIAEGRSVFHDRKHA